MRIFDFQSHSISYKGVGILPSFVAVLNSKRRGLTNEGSIRPDHSDINMSSNADAQPDKN